MGLISISEIFVYLQIQKDFDTIITINGNLSVHKRTDARTSAGSETAERYVFEKKDGCHKV